MSRIISIEGNIGVGKTTFIELCKNAIIEKTNKPVIFLKEPVELWQSIKDRNNKDILTYFYEDNKTWAFSFQMMAYISRLSILKKTISDNPDAIIIMERSVFTDKNVFAKMLYDDNLINEIDYQIYNTWFNHFSEMTNLDGIIYLQCDPKIAHSRVIERSRSGEIISLEYLQKCNQYHDNWILNSNINTIIINSNEENSLSNQKKWILQIVEFIN